MNPELRSAVPPAIRPCKGMFEVMRGTARAPDDAKYLCCPLHFGRVLFLKLINLL